jgi:hydrogenase small subunit
MPDDDTLGVHLRRQGVSRRTFLKFCTAMTSLMALPPTAVAQVAQALEKSRRRSVIWLSFQECTGCAESLTRAHSPSLEGLIFDFISLDYHHTLQAASGTAAEAAREEAMKENWGNYLVIVDGSLPAEQGGYGTWAGVSFRHILEETAKGAAAIVSIGTCASFGGIPEARPNPTGAVPVSALIQDKPIVNVPGCPPIPAVISGVIAHYLTFGVVPELDPLNRPVAFYGDTIHDRCYRRPFYDQGKFAKSFDDEGARRGWCLFELGCRGPVTYNACATVKWNQGTSFPIESGHGCIGCSEPHFWDRGSFYQPISAGLIGPNWQLGVAAAAGLAAGAAAASLARKRQKELQQPETAMRKSP